MAFTRRATSIGWIVFSAVVTGAGLDAPVVSQMHLAVPGTDQVRLLARVQADSELDLVAVLAGSKDWPPGYAPWFWNDKRILGIFLQRRNNPATVYKIAVQQGPLDCEARVERATATDLVISCTPEKGNLRGPNHKFVYNTRSKALIGKLEYQPFSMPRLFASGETAVLVGSDRKQLIALEFDPAKQIPFHLLQGSAADRWTRRVRTTVNSIGFGSEFEQFVDVPFKPFHPLRFGPENRFGLVSNQPPSPNIPASGLTVIEHFGKKTKSYPLPRTSYDEFARLRPASVRNGYTRAVAQFHEQIGPAQVADGTFWFAKRFDDGEGETGIGGFGFFDSETRNYKIYSPPEIVDWSATAMLVEPEAVWLGLASDGEYRDTSGGLLRFDRATGKCSKIALSDLVFGIARVRDSLILATDFGAAVVREDKVRRFFIDRTARGQLLVSEALVP